MALTDIETAEVERIVKRMFGSISAPIAALQDGTLLSDGHRVLNFQGSGVTVADDPALRRVNILIPGAPVSSTSSAVLNSSTSAKAHSLWNGSSNDAPPTNWEQPSFSDSGWSAAVAGTTQGNPPYDDAISGTTQISSSATPPANNVQVLTRQHFTLGSATITAATLSMKVDDEVMDVFLNGTRLAITVGYATTPATTSVSPSLLVTGGGDNVLAVRFRSVTPTKQWLDYQLSTTTGAAAASSITIKEVDGAPSVLASILRLPNGSLTDDGGGQVTYTAPSGASVTVQEVDGAPAVTATVIRFPNGTLTDDGGGQVTYTPTSFSLPSPVTNALGSDVTCTNANQYYDGPSVTIGAGTWRLSGSVTVYNAAAGGTFNWTAKLWNGTTVYASTQATQTNNSYVVSLSLSWVITVASSTTVKISAACSTAGGLIKAAALNNGAGNNASTLSASAA